MSLAQPVPAAMACPACGQPLSTGIRAWHRPCSSCTYEASSLEPHILDQGDGGDLDEDAREDALRDLRQRNFKRVSIRIRALVSRGKAAGNLPSVLDVGCAHGWFLKEMKRDFQIAGIEPDPHVANSAERQGLPIRAGFFPDALADGETYDVIVFNDVLEHIPPLDATLAACVRHLKPGGLLVVNAPDRTGFIYRFSKLLARCGLPSSFERMWQVGFPSPHVHYFDTPCLRAIAERHGFLALESHRLHSVSASGLHSRIRYSKDATVVGAMAMTGLAAAAIPFLAVLPADIRVWIFRAAW